MKRNYIVRMILILLITTPVISSHVGDRQANMGSVFVKMCDTDGQHPVSPSKSPRRRLSEVSTIEKHSIHLSFEASVYACAPSHRVPPTPSPEKIESASTEGRLHRAGSAFSLESAFAAFEK